MKESLELIKRGIDEVLTEDDLVSKLKSKKQLINKVGFDPTAPDLHLGHTVILNKMRHFQDLGHKVVFLIGDFTGRIGDPSGKNKTRPALDKDELKKNAKVFESKKLYDNQVQNWISDTINLAGFSIDRKSVSLINEHLEIDS